MTRAVSLVLLVATLAVSGCGGGGGGQPANKPPVASFTANPSSGPAPLRVNVDARQSTDSDGSITSYEWIFGDGQSATGAVAAHVYDKSGSYEIQLTVTDNEGATAKADQVIQVTAASTYTVGGTVSGLTSTGLVLENNGTDSLPIGASGGFVFATPLAPGAAYNVTVKTQPTGLATCRVANGSGTVAASNVTDVRVTCTKRYAYVANAGSNSVSVYTVNSATGELIDTGLTAATELLPRSIVVDPSSSFVYVANDASDSISAYAINADTGGLTAVGAAVSAEDGPYFVTVDPTGRFVYVVNNRANSVSTYAIDRRTGALASAGAPVATGVRPVCIAVSPNGKFAYVANGDYVVSTFAINASTGALTSAGADVPTGGWGVFYVAVDPSGRFAYVANSNSSTVSAFAINATTGALTSAGPPVNSGTFPRSIAIAPDGRYLYVTNLSSTNVSSFAINITTGALNGLGWVGAVYGPSSVAVDPDGKFAYVVQLANIVASYAIDPATGALTNLGMTVATGSNPFQIALTR